MELGAATKKKLMVIGVLWLSAVVLYVSLGSGKTVSRMPGTAAKPVKVRLDLLEKKREPSYAVKRDIFRPFAKKVVPKPVVQPPVVVVPVPPPEPMVAVFAREAKFMGYVDKSAKKTIFIVRGPDVYIVKVGDVVENYYKVVEISGDSVKLVDERTNEEAYIKASAAVN